MSDRGEVLVLGGGVVGVCSALSLAERGVPVRLLERGEIASGCSWGNAGWIFPGHSMPIPAPGVMRNSLGWLLSPESPLSIKPRASPALARWLWHFWRACREPAMRRAFALRRELSLASLERYENLATSAGLARHFHRNGLVVACRTQQGLDEISRELAILRQLGGRGEELSGTALRNTVPELREGLAGGVLLPDEAHLVPGAFVRELAKLATGLGARIETGVEVLALEPRRGRTPRVLTTRGPLEPDELVLAAGAETPPLARALGLRVPVESAKGYSITVRRPDGFGDRPLMLSEAKVAVSPMHDELRFAGTLELAGLDWRVNLRRVRAIAAAVREWLPGVPETEHLETWRGHRPLTPDDLPIIGRARGVILATGHGMKGISQGAITGELVAQLICGEPTAVDLAPFSPARF